MKISMVLALCIMVCLLAMPSALGNMVASSLDIALAGQSPSPAEPGGNVGLDVYIENTGYGEAGEVVVEALPAHPFTLVQGDRVKKFTKIGAASSVKSSYTFYVDESVITNTYEIEFRVYSNKTPSAVVRKKLPVSIRGEPKLIITDIQVSPGGIEPGSLVGIMAVIRNVGTGKARYIELGLNSSSSYLVPVLSKGSAYLEELGPGSEEEIHFQMSVDMSADYKTYITSITADYKDEENEEREVVFDLGVPVRGTISLGIIDTEMNQQRGILRIEVANKGTSEAKSLEARLIIGNRTLGIDYLTNLKANKQTTFDFPLVYKGSGELVIDYIGPGIEKNQAREEVVLNFEEPKGGNGSGLVIGAVVVIIVVAVVCIFVRRRGKRKR